MRARFAVALLLCAACGHRAPQATSGPAPSAVVSAKPNAAGLPPAPARAPRTRRISKRPRIASLDVKTYIHAAPMPQSPEIGTIALGTSVPLANPKPLNHAGCSGGWYAVEPKGYVCLDASTTLDVDDHPLLCAKRGRTGHFDDDVPYHWGESRDAPLYTRLPTRDEQFRAEPALERHLSRIEALRSAAQRKNDGEQARLSGRLGELDVSKAEGDPPPFLAGGALSPFVQAHPRIGTSRARYGSVPIRSTVAWTDEFFAEGRSWVLTTDLFVVPKDKLIAQPSSDFHGVFLDGVRLPIAFIPRRDRPKYKLVDGEAVEVAVVPVSYSSAAEAPDNDLDPFRDDARSSPGKLVETDARFVRLSWVGLTGRARYQGNERFLETSDGGAFIRAADATVIQAMPPRGFEVTKGEKWIDVSIYRGTLVAYEGRTPVFATLISPGLRGYAREGGRPTKNTTPVGTFRIEWKHLSTTMSPNPTTNSYYLSEVPFTQFFHMPFALHAAYWHDRFGEPKSGGCVNLSIADARWLFGWTDPKLPRGWHAVRAGDDRGAGTWVSVH